MTTIDQFGKDEARKRDADDSLRYLRARFEIPADTIYLDGNSLGMLPSATSAVMQDAVTLQWGHDLIRSWNNNAWIEAPQRVGGKISQLIGASSHEVIVADSVSVNIFKLLTALARQRPDRTKILTEANNFPTDVHVAQGAADVLGLQLELAPRDELLERLDKSTAVLLLSHVHFKSGQRFDMAAMNASARSYDVPVLWDLCHSAGAIPLDLKNDGTRFAVGCGYKFLNGGPGAPAFIYVSADQQDPLNSALQGWMGHASPFAFEDEFRPARGLDRFLVGTAPILSLLALECGVDAFANVDIQAVWKKSQQMFDFLAAQMATNCPELQLVTSHDADQRGSHASFSHPDASAIIDALIARRVIGDFRTPNILRFGLTPLYTSFQELARAVETLTDILTNEDWRKPEY
jgi:kynureninase